MMTKRAILILLAALPMLAQRGGAGGRGGGGGGFPSGGGSIQRGGGGFSGARSGGGISAAPNPGIGRGLGNPYGNLGPTPFSNQTYGSYGAGSFNSGFGSVVFPSGIRSFGSYVSPVYSSLPVVGGYSGGGFIGPSRARTAIYPVFVGGYAYGSGYQDPQQVTIINQQPPAVIVNPNYVADSPARPVMRIYGAGADPSVNTIQVASPSYPEGRPLSEATQIADVTPSEEPTVYLIALKDGTIYASYAFWLERDSVHYITPGHAHNQVSLDQVDVALSRRLNRERKLDFNLR